MKFLDEQTNSNLEKISQPNGEKTNWIDYLIGSVNLLFTETWDDYYNFLVTKKQSEDSNTESIKNILYFPHNIGSTILSEYTDQLQNLPGQQYASSKANFLKIAYTNAPNIDTYSLDSYTSSKNRGSFVDALPSVYEVFPGYLVKSNEFLTAVEGGMYGAPLPDSAPDDTFVFGNPNNRYAWVYTGEESIKYDIEKQKNTFQIPPSFQLNGDDALVLFGETPPLISYMSFNLYNTLRLRSDGEEGSVDGYSYSGSSIGLSLNHANLKTTNNNGNAPFENKFAIIVTSNTKTRDDVRRALIDAGVPRRIINSYLFPAKFADLGKTEKPNQLSFLARYTFQTEDEKKIIKDYTENISTIKDKINFNEYYLESYGSFEDEYYQVDFADDGATIILIGNTWKKISDSFSITENTVLEFDFRSDELGGIHGIAFNSGEFINENLFFKLYGTEDQGIEVFNNYDGSGDWQNYEIPVGQFYTGEMNALTFINDNDIEPSSSNSTFSNIKIYEKVVEPVINVAFVKGIGQDGDVDISDIPNWTQTLRTNDAEIQLKDNLEILKADTVDYYEQKGYFLKDVFTEEFRFVDSEANREADGFGAYDSPDALYSSFRGGEEDPLLGSIISLENDEILVMVGIDHSLAGSGDNAAYWSYESKPVNFSGAKTFSFTNHYTQGSATQYTNEDTADSLFAVNITYSNTFGGGQPYTVNIPYKLGKTSKSNQFSILGRVYLDTVTGTAPNPDNLIPAEILWLSPQSLV